MIRLQTELFIIIDLFSTDLENIHQLHSLPETDEFNTLGIPETIQTTEKILNAWLKKQTDFSRTSYVLAVELSGSKTFIGLIALNLEIQILRLQKCGIKFMLQHFGKVMWTKH